MNANLLIGQNLGRYHIVESLGQGGMATVFRGYDTSLDRDVAIKVIRPDMNETIGGEFLKRFQHEARSLAKLDHPFILKVLDYGEQNGLPYLVMPFVPGGTLKQKMGKAIPYPEAARLLAPIAHALDYAHHQNIIHRDVKPANILISQSGSPLLSDFGIAKLLDSGASAQLTATGVGIGTPDYMAPEQWMGQADAGTDMYSLGIVFYEMVTGHLPFSADTPAAVLLKHLRDPLPRPKSFISNLPDAVEQILFKALAKEPSNRYLDMGEFARILEMLSQTDNSKTRFAQLSASVQNKTYNAKTDVATESDVRQHNQSNNTSAPIVISSSGSRNLKFGLLAIGIIFGFMVICIFFGIVLYGSRNFLSVYSFSSTQNAQYTPTPGNSALIVKSTMTVIGNNNPTIQPTNIRPIVSIDGLPDDIPLLENNNGDLTTQLSQGMTMYYFSTNISVENGITFYQTGMEKNGWKLVNETKSNGQSMYYFSKEPKRIVMIGINTHNGKTLITILIPPVQ